jgi:glutaredoxin
MLARILRRVAAFPFLLLPVFCAQAQYKWTDPDGRVNYGDQPPRNARQVERINAAAGAVASADDLAGLPFEVRNAAKNFPVVLYVTVATECAPCTRARDFLKARAIPFVERTIATNKDLTAFQALGGGRQFPVVTVGRNWLPGFEPNAWSEALNDAGYPQGATLPRTWQWPAATPLAAPDPAPAPASATPPSEAN